MTAKAVVVGALSAGIPGDVGPLYLQPFEPYGSVVFQTRPEAPNQIYIVGQLHEHPIINDVNQETIETQRDIYRIGEQLIKERELELVVLEGLSADESHDTLNVALRNIGKILKRRNILDSLGTDDRQLERLLDTEIEGVSPPGPRLLEAQAGYWLASAYNCRVAGAEDADLLSLGLKAIQGKWQVIQSARRERGLAVLSALEMFTPITLHLKQLRTAYILHNTPLVMEREHAAKRIRHTQALVVIGAAHIHECIEFVRNDYLKVPAYQGSSVPPLDQPLGYVQASYGVTVIMPRTIEQLRP